MSRREQIRQQLRAKFLGVAKERIAQIGAALVSVEERPDDEALANDLMREIHTLKGEAKLVGFDQINLVAHKTEELFLHARELPEADRPPVHRMVVRGLDTMAELLANESDGGGKEVDVASFVAEAERAKSDVAAARSTDEQVKAAPQTTSMASRQLMGLRGDSSIRIDLHRLHQLTELASALLLEHERIEHDLDEIAQSMKGWATTVDRIEALLPVFTRHATTPAAQEAARSLGEILRHGRVSRSDSRRAAESASEDVFEFRLRLRELDAQIRSLRLQPLSAMFLHYPRAVRDLANEQGKKIALAVQGADVEVDKEVLDKLADPLLHLIRNAVDHGMERPEERAAAGKAESATLTLSARQRGYFVEIRVTDDGRGIDPDRVRKAAVRRGILAANMAEQRSDAEILSVIFAPGFSTTETVTDVSGRGVGLDVVKAGLEHLGGSVHVETELGRGTTFILTAPIAMVFTRALLVSSGDTAYALPSEAVLRVVELEASAISSLAGSSAIRFEDDWVSVLDLRDGASASRSRAGALVSFVLIEHLDRRLAIAVDRFLGERQVVQRSFDRYLGGDRLLAGAVILESGMLAILLDVAELARMASAGTTLGRPKVDEPAAAEELSVLVVDDSEVTRDLLCSILRAHGYQVHEAVNGKNGVEAIERFRPGLVITDLEMPVLDGFGLLREVRARAEFAHLPVVVFSTRGSDPDKRKASELGADAYLVKGQFREEDLVGLAQRYVRS